MNQLSANGTRKAVPRHKEVLCSSGVDSMFRLLLFVVALVLACGGAEAAKLDQTAVNQAQFVVSPPKGVNPAVLKAQILLDRARFSPGMIDGRLQRTSPRRLGPFRPRTDSHQMASSLGKPGTN